MSRHWTGESDNPLDWGRYTAALRSSLRGRRGQKLIKEMIAALDALPKPELTVGALADADNGCCCALGAVALNRGKPFDELSKDNGNWSPEDIASDFDISATLANEIIDQNDNCYGESDKPVARRLRWRHMKNWATKHLASVK